MSDVPAKLIEEEEKPKACVSESIFENMKNTLIKNLSEEDRKSYQEFGEKFHRTLDTMGFQTGKKEISMEESLSYIVESLKSGLHPRYLSDDEQRLVEAGYGKTWYKKWGYDSLE